MSDKRAAGLAKKAANKDAAQAKLDAEAARQEEIAWQDGAKKGSKKAEAEADKKARALERKAMATAQVGCFWRESALVGAVEGAWHMERHAPPLGTHPPTHPPTHSLTHPPTHLPIHSPIHLLTHSLTYSHTHSLT